MTVEYGFDFKKYLVRLCWCVSNWLAVLSPFALSGEYETGGGSV